MSEVLTTHLLSDLQNSLPMERGEFYASQVARFKEGKKPDRSVEIVQAFLFTPEGDIILQKRSHEKTHNPGLIDKTIGGHIVFGDTSNYTLTVETLQELQVPSIVLSSMEDFSKTFHLLRTFLAQTALIQLIDTQTASFLKHINGELVPIVNTYHLYFGVYGGSIRPADHEASGILFYTKESLERELKQSPDFFTEDLKFFLPAYQTEMVRFFQQIS